MTAAGLIFTNIHDDSLREMTARRAMASVPFGGRYRLVDFPLSCMVNADVVKIGVVTHDNYQSLLSHLGSGKDWDLARRSGGIRILPPLVSAYHNSVAGRVYSTRLEALMGVTDFIEKCTEDVVVLSDANAVFNMDFRRIIEAHGRSGAEMTFVTKRMPASRCPVGRDVKVMTADDGGRLVDLKEFDPFDHVGEIPVYTNVTVASRDYLLRVIRDAIARSYKSYFSDVVKNRMREDYFAVYPYDGYYDMIVSLAGYYRASMELLDTDVRRALLGNGTLPIYTKVRNSAPTVFTEHADVRGSLIADGCLIEGRVENSILFRGVHVARGAVVKDSILLQDTAVGENAWISCTVADKDVVLREGRHLSGDAVQPYYIEKRRTI